MVSLDKGLTAFNILSVQKNHPEVNALSIEKNPVAKVFYEKLGLVGGTVVYWVLSVFTFLLATYLFSFPAKIIAPDNQLGVALYAMVIFYSFVIGNNFYFAFRYNGLI
jgi:hypothetical protein